MAEFTITRYYLENGRPIEERTTYFHAATLVDGVAVSTDPRARQLSELILITAHAEELPNWWFSYQFADPACDVQGAVRDADGGIVDVDHWMWNMIEDGPPRPGVTFCSKDEFDDHTRHMAQWAAREAARLAEGN